MVKYLSLDGVDDRLRPPTLSYNKIEYDVWLDSSKTSEQWLIDERNNGASGYRRWSLASGFNGNTLFSQSGSGVDQRVTLTLLTTDGVHNATPYLFSDNAGGRTFKGNVYNVKFYNDTTLVAHYDMSTGTVQDQSGNGNHATLTGGTWMDDGTGGTDTGTDGSTLFDVKQVIFQDSALTADTKQSLYADNSLTTDLLQRIYSDGYISSDTKQAIYSDGYTQADTKQILYELSSTVFDTLQEYYEDGQIGSTPFDMRMVLYSDEITVFDSAQAYYESGSVNVDLKQAIYENGQSDGDMRLIIYSDEAARADLRQLLYSDAYTSFDTKQVLYDAETQVIGVIKLKGKRQLYVYLKGKRELEVHLKGGLNVTEYNQNFTMESGDSKILNYAIDEDLTGATLTWEMYQRGQITPLISKTGTFANANVQIELIPTDTQNVYGTYRYELQCVDVLSKKSTLAKGVITLE